MNPIKDYSSFLNENKTVSVEKFIQTLRNPFDDTEKFLDSFKEFKSYKSTYTDYEVDLYEIPLDAFTKVTGWGLSEIAQLGKEFHPHGDGWFYYNPKNKTVNLQFPS